MYLCIFFFQNVTHKPPAIMNVRIESDFRFSVAAIQYTPQGELCITLSSGDSTSATRYHYTANLGNWQAEEKPTVCLLQYARNFAASANIKDKTKDSYRLMCNHLEAYGDSLVCILQNTLLAQLCF